MTDSTYILTLVNDRDFYRLRDNVRQACLRALYLYNAYHSEDGLTPSEQLTCIAAALDEFTEDHKHD